ncbi:putative late blight resistance protein-like protein R1B-13 [Forsythia ovata]|uniref:Late blight resistance protein-like protein R1B-13 n=1 Tax=Forsythia ovata TaxID=205694 RepID=A0ABD1WPD9_9LAMI
MSILEIKNKIDVAGVPEVSKYPGEHVSLQSKEPPILEDIVVGFDNIEIEIAEQLVGGTDQLQIISIYGMPGLGKTTLANKVYNNPSVVYHFHKRAWCVVSQTYNKKHVLIDILSSMKNLKGEKIVNMDDESLAEDLYKSLKGRRYLIVMDDIWDTEVWDDLKRYFPDDGIGSRILFTTRNKEVGSKASPGSVKSALPFLSEDECWELLRRKVFQDKNCPQELLHIGKQIAINCHGLPLAVVVIAGVLANMEKKEHLWQKQHHHLSINYNSTNILSLPFGLHVRSLLCFDRELPISISCSFKVVRVLDFFEIEEDDVVIGFEQLVHLRYLSISTILPPMESFHRLECLVVDRPDEVEIPDILLNMLSLRHLHFLGGGHFSASCLQQATNNESFQINNNLQSISVINIFDENHVKILRCLPNLRRLKAIIYSSPNYSFDFLNQLESLKLRSQYSLSNLFSLPLNLKQLTLVDTHISSEQIEIIGKLEYLEVLKLKNVGFEGEQWDTSEGGFPRLKFLKLYKVQIVQWNAASDHFPRLQQLVLEFCDRLKMIPPNLGDIPTLEMIKVYKCAKAIEDSAKHIQEEQQDSGNEELKLIIISDRRYIRRYITFGSLQRYFRR